MAIRRQNLSLKQQSSCQIMMKLMMILIRRLTFSVQTQAATSLMLVLHQIKKRQSRSLLLIMVVTVSSTVNWRYLRLLHREMTIPLLQHPIDSLLYQLRLCSGPLPKHRIPVLHYSLLIVKATPMFWFLFACQNTECILWLIDCQTTVPCQGKHLR